MNNPELGLPKDPFRTFDFPMTPELKELFQLGIAQGIIEQLSAKDFAVEAYILTKRCVEHRKDGVPAGFIDEYAIGFAKMHDEEIYENALVAWIISNPDLDIAI